MNLAVNNLLQRDDEGDDPTDDEDPYMHGGKWHDLISQNLNCIYSGGTALHEFYLILRKYTVKIGKYRAIKFMIKLIKSNIFNKNACKKKLLSQKLLVGI